MQADFLSLWSRHLWSIAHTDIKCYLYNRDTVSTFIEIQLQFPFETLWREAHAKTNRVVMLVKKATNILQAATRLRCDGILNDGLLQIHCCVRRWENVKNRFRHLAKSPASVYCMHLFWPIVAGFYAPPYVTLNVSCCSTTLPLTL